MNDITQDELQSIIDDITSTKVEMQFAASWIVIEGYHKIGERLQGVKNNRELLSRVTKYTGVKERNLYRAIQFYEKCPNLNALEYGKNVSWRMLCNEYLPTPTDKEPEPEMCTCPDCGREHRKLI